MGDGLDVCVDYYIYQPISLKIKNICFLIPISQDRFETLGEVLSAFLSGGGYFGLQLHAQKTLSSANETDLTLPPALAALLAQGAVAAAVPRVRAAVLRLPGGSGAGSSGIELPRHPRQLGRVQQPKG